MYKKVIPFIIALPALLLIFFFKIIPAVYVLVLSLKDYNVMRGIFGSPWVGTDNYRELFQSVHFRNIFSNTLTLNSLSTILTALFAFVLIICISKMPNKWFKLGAIAILSIPAFIPATSFVGVFFKTFSVDSGIINKFIISSGNEPILFFADKALYPLLFAMMDSLRSVFIPVIIGVLVCEHKGKLSFESIAIVIAGYIAARVTMFLSPDIELLYLTNNPLVYETADVIDTYSIRTGLMSMRFPSGSALWVIKTIIQLVINIAVYFLFALIAPKISDALKGISNKVNRSMSSVAAIIGYLLFASGSLAVIILAFVLVPGNILEGMGLLLTNKQFINAISASLLYCIFGSIIYGFITIALSYPLTVRTKIYPILLVIIMSLVNNFVGEYLFFKTMGMINTVLPVILSPGLSVIGAFALYFSVSGGFKDDIPDVGEYIKKAIYPLVTIVALYFIANWGGYIYQLVFLSDTNMRGIGLLGMQLLTMQDNGNIALSSARPEIVENIKAAYIFISSIIPVVIGTVLIFLSKYFPLSAFVSHIRRA